MRLKLLKGLKRKYELNLTYIFEIQLFIVSIISFLTTMLIEKFTEKIWVNFGYIIIKKFNLK